MNNNELLSTANEVDNRIALLEALERLENNPDFRKLILNHYCEDEVIRLHSLLANFTLKAQGKRADIMEYLVAISTFKDFLLDIRRSGESARYQKQNPIEDIQKED